jgi:hypothetical protein
LTPADEDLIKMIVGHVNELGAIPFWHNQTTKEKYLDEDGNIRPRRISSFIGFGDSRLDRGTCPSASFARFWTVENCLTGLGNGRTLATITKRFGSALPSLQKLS